MAPIPRMTPEAICACMSSKLSPLYIPIASSTQIANIRDRCGTQPKPIMVMPMIPMTMADIIKASLALINVRGFGGIGCPYVAEKFNSFRYSGVRIYS